MTNDVTPSLDGQFHEYKIIRVLHEVPPHEVYEVEVNGQRAVHKFNTHSIGAAGLEGRVMAFLSQNTSVPVPEILAVGDDYYVSAWDSNAPLPNTGPAADKTWAWAAGKGLATLHAETAPHVTQFGQVTLDTNHEHFVVNGYDDWHAAAMNYVLGLEETLAEFGHADAATAVHDHLHDHPDCFDHQEVVSRTDTMKEQELDPVCCHGWWTPEHVGVGEPSSTGGAVQTVIDWEHAMAAPAEWDYWRTVLPTFENGGPQQAFREGYESIRGLPAINEERRSLFLLLIWLSYFESLYVQNQHDEAETQKRANFIQERVFEILDSR